MGRAKNTPIKLPCCIKLAFHFISWGRCTVKQTSSPHLQVFKSVNCKQSLMLEDEEKDIPQHNVRHHSPSHAVSHPTTQCVTPLTKPCSITPHNTMSDTTHPAMQCHTPQHNVRHHSPSHAVSHPTTQCQTPLTQPCNVTPHNTMSDTTHPAMQCHTPQHNVWHHSPSHAVAHLRRPEYSRDVSQQDGTSQELHNNKGDEQLKGLQTVTALILLCLQKFCCFLQLQSMCH